MQVTGLMLVIANKECDTQQVCLLCFEMTQFAAESQDWSSDTKWVCVHVFYMSNCEVQRNKRV